MPFAGLFRRDAIGVFPGVLRHETEVFPDGFAALARQVPQPRNAVNRLFHRSDTANWLKLVWANQSPALRGMIFMCLSTICFSAMHGLIRFMSSGVPPFQMVFFRSLFGLLVFVPLLLHSRFRILRTGQLSRHAILGLINICSMLMFFTALSTIPLATVTALSFTAPIFVTLLSLVILKERLHLHRIVATALGFCGILIILWPGLVPANAGLFLVVGSAFLWASVMLLIKVISRTESSITIVAWMGVFLCLFSLGPALSVWQPLDLRDLMWLSALGMSGVLAQLFLGQAFKQTDPTIVMPFDFLRMIWTVLIGIWVFSELPSYFTWIGAVAIFVSGLMVVFFDRRKQLPP